MIEDPHSMQGSLCKLTCDIVKVASPVRTIERQASHRTGAVWSSNQDVWIKMKAIDVNEIIIIVKETIDLNTLRKRKLKVPQEACLNNGVMSSRRRVM